MFLIDNCNNEKNKDIIINKISNLDLSEILLFIGYLDKSKFEIQINHFIKDFGLIDNLENRDKLFNFLLYFDNVKKILNNKMQ